MLVLFCLVRMAYELGQDLPITMLSLFMSIAGGVSHSTIGLYHITVFAGKETNLQSQGRPTWMITIMFSFQTEATLKTFDILHYIQTWTSFKFKFLEMIFSQRKPGDPWIPQWIPRFLFGTFWNGVFFCLDLVHVGASICIDFAWFSKATTWSSETKIPMIDDAFALSSAVKRLGTRTIPGI